MARPDWVRALLKQAEIMGIPVERTRSDHWKLRLPRGNAMIPNSPSDIRTQQNCMRDLRKLGWDELKEEYSQKVKQARADRLARGMQGAVAPHEFEPILPEPESENPEVIPPKETDSNLGWVEIEGTRLAIAEIAVPVRHQHYRGGEPRVLPQSEELLLVDGSVRYRCRKPTGAWVGDGPVLCDRHFETPGGLVVHWARGVHADDVPELKPAASQRAEPEPEPLAVAEPGLMARMEDLGQEMLDIHFEAQRLANHSQDVHQRMVELAQEVSQNLASDELRQKAEILDQMRGLLR